MTLDFVNQKTIDGKVYTAYRDANDPAQTFIVRDDVLVPAILKDVWNDKDKLTSLFNG